MGLISSFLDSGFRRNDDQEACPAQFVTPAKAGVQFKLAKKEMFQTMMSIQ
jgi:hypothetical protein